MATDWTKALQNPQALRAAWDAPPPLDGARLAELSLTEDRLRLRFDPPAAPDRVHTRWPAESNRVQITLDLFFIEALTSDGAPTGRCEAFALAPDGERVRLTARAGAACLDVVARYAQIVELSGYVDGAVEPD